MQVIRYTVLRIWSHYSTDLQVGVTCQDMQQCTSKGREEDCKLAYMTLTVNDDMNMLLISLFIGVMACEEELFFPQCT